MSLFQLVATVFGLFMLYVINIHRRKSRLSSTEVSFWYSTWAFFVIIALFPNLLLEVSMVLRFSRVFDLLVVMAFMVLSTVSISNYLQAKESAHQLEKLVREMAIRDAKHRQKKK